MSKEAIRAWFENLPKIERDMPSIPYKGQVLSPRQILEMAEAGTLPEDLQEKIEKGEFTTAEDVYKIGLERVRAYLKQLPPDFIIYIGQQPYTVAEILEEIEKGTPIGRAFVEMEIQKWEQLYRR
jgi:hypothetical protein